MHITDSQLKLGNQHVLESTSFVELRLERLAPRVNDSTDRQQFEEALRSMLENRMQQSAPEVIKPCCSLEERKQDLLGSMLNLLFGQTRGGPAPQFEGDAVATPSLLEGSTPRLALPRPQWQLTRTEGRSEFERCEFSAHGKVCLADGSERQFDLGFRFERSEQTVETTRRRLIDPLILDLGPASGALGDATADFDLDADGKLERMRMPTTDSAFLFLDRNHNGKADDGKELFGTQSGDGFADLAKLDGDHNGWIDEADAAFADLRLWQADDKGSRVRTLADAGVGALATQSAATPYALKDKGETLGQMRASSLWLGETGGAGTVREIDLGVTAIPA
jgi:hypothetical protein